MNSADRAHWQSIVNLGENDLDACLVEVPADAGVVHALRALRLAKSTNERAAAIRARDRAYRQRVFAELDANRETRLSSAMTMTGGLTLLFGVPAGIVLGFTLGWWWSLLVVLGVVVVALVLSEVTKKRKIQD